MSNWYRAVRPICARGLVVAAMAFAALPSVSRAEEQEEAVKVFQTMKPSVVSISNSEGSGTGIILDKEGRILTCAHVVTSPVAYKVKIDVGTADEPKELTFEHVQILGYHPERDLAIIKIDPKEQGITLTPATISTEKGSSGQRIYAIGDPGAGDKVLTKTITQGIISGVDREFDAQKFYQIDATINPGNSGGPVVDHNGKVMGIVTFSFNKLQALNFAIPLKDIDFNKFVPLTEHKSNPQRAEELLAQAKQFTALAQQALKQGGADGDQYKLYTFYAVYCFSEALIYDPSNPEIYTDIGTTLIAIEKYDNAAAYLVRAVELRPWGPISGQSYLELGVAFQKQKMEDKALATWKEGLAKFPYASSLWDDQSIYYMQKEEYSKAAYSASVALACGARKGRIANLQRLLHDARAKLDESERQELASKVDHDAIVSELDGMRNKSNKARKKKSLYMTTEFVELIKKVGTLDIPGIEDKISQVPLKPPTRLTTGDDVDDAADDKTDDEPKTKKHKKVVAADDDADSDDDAPKKKKHADYSGDDEDGPKHVKPAADDDDDSADDKPHKKTKAKDKDADADDSDDDTPKIPPRKVVPPGGGGDDWIDGPKVGPGGGAGTTEKGGDNPAPPSTVILPTPAITGIELAGEVQTVDDAKMTPLDVDKQEIATAVMGTDGNYVYVVHKDGLLRKVAVPSLKEERQLDLGNPCTAIGVTKSGIVVAVSNINEIWLLDPSTLAVKHRVIAAGITRIASCPSSNLVIVSDGADSLRLIDMTGEKTVQKYTGARLAAGGTHVPALTFSQIAMSPDGTTFYCPGGDSLCQFTIDGHSLKFNTSGPKLGAEPMSIDVSPDGKYVAMPCKGGNEVVGSGPRKDYCTYVFKVADLNTPVMTIEGGATPVVLAFDAPAKQIYTQNSQKNLVVFTPAGAKVKDYTLIDGKASTTQKLLVSPTGRSLFVLAGAKMFWVTLP